MIKLRPEEFRVVEKATLDLSSSGPYFVYRLTKKNLTTEQACRLIARNFNYPLSSISWGGRKDKYGLTTQYITIFQGREIAFKEKNIWLEPVGFMDRPMGPDLIEGNFFEITLRKINNLEAILKAIEEVKIQGLANYFDDQRFRSYDPKRGFFAEKILLRHYNGALQVYLTSITPSMKKRERERREAFLANWRNWEKCYEIAQKPEEKKIFGALRKYPHEPQKALQFIPPPEVAFLYSAYQAHLWNELLRRLIRLQGVGLKSSPGREGDYLFWQLPDEKMRNYFHGLQLPTAALKMEFPDKTTELLFLGILEEKGLRPTSFRTKVLRLVSFRSFLRPAAAFPLNCQILGSGEDEIYPGRKKITLAFELGRGSYATMLIKRLTLENGDTNIFFSNGEAEGDHAFNSSQNGQ